jgi:lipid-A-disaccharide synthase
VETRFTGHPLIDGLVPEVDAATFRAELGVGPDARILGLLPGSRRQEVEQLLPTLIETARLLAVDRPDVVAVVPAAPGLRSEALERAGRVAWVRVVRDRTHAVQAHATCCAVASGTATLETALLGTPLAIVYRTGWLNFAIARRMITLSRIGLPNIVAGHEVAPELIQRDLTPQRLAAALAAWLDDPAARARQSAGLAEVRARLGAPGAATRAAAWLWELAS